MGSQNIFYANSIWRTLAILKMLKLQ